MKQQNKPQQPANQPNPNKWNQDMPQHKNPGGQPKPNKPGCDKPHQKF